MRLLRAVKEARTARHNVVQTVADSGLGGEGWVSQSVRLEGGAVVPILGLMEVLAASRLLADTDVLGGGGKNAGFVVERDGDGHPLAVRVVKVRA